MPELSGKNYSLYLNGEVVEKFERVQAHLSKGVSQSIAHLIEDKDLQIKDGLTRRDQIAALREEIEALKQDVGWKYSIIEQTLLIVLDALGVPLPEKETENDTDHG